jgi:hypothetical protein
MLFKLFSHISRIAIRREKNQRGIRAAGGSGSELPPRRKACRNSDQHSPTANL